MSYPKSLYRKLVTIPKITSMFPLLYQKNDFSAVCKNGAVVALIELQGVDYTGMSPEKYNISFMTRKRVFEKESPFIRIDVLSRKTQDSAESKFSKSESDPIINLMNKSWKSNFDMVFRTKHYLMITVNHGGLLEKVGSLVSSDYKIDKDQLLSDTVEELCVDLKDFHPRVLENHEISSYFATLLTGRDTTLNAKNWDQTLADHPIDFDPKLNYCTYGRHGDTIFSGWLSICRYPESIGQDTLERVFKLPIRFNLYQSFQTYPKNKAMDRFEDKAKELMNFGGGNDEYEKQIFEFSTAVAADKLSLVSHCFAIEVLGDSERELEENIRTIRNTLISGNEMKVYRETSNIEALFWSRFPTMQGFNLRKRDLSSENASHLATFNSVGEGFDTCGFGDRPVALFKTVEGGQYSFTFHQTAEMKPDILGHTAVFGGTGTGKTTLLAFLIANCLSYKDFKAICFDRLGGLKAFTNVFDGDYLDFPEDVQMNPFLMKDTSVNRMFLFSWLKRLAKLDDNNTVFNSRINDIINTNFELDKADRCFDALTVAMGLEGDELYSRFEQWLPNGIRSDFFNAPRDSFDFSKKIITFDATYILDQPEILTNVTDYIFHKVMTQVSENITPHIMCFDESPRYFQEPVFAKKMLEGLKELRKKAGVVCLAAQDPSTYRMLPNDTGGEILNALAHIIVYPNRSAERVDYIDFLGLNEKEFHWVKHNDPNSRKVLVKKRSTESSVILDVDLSSLRTTNYNLLNAFNSSASAIEKLKNLQRDDPINWKLKYLRAVL